MRSPRHRWSYWSNRKSLNRDTFSSSPRKRGPSGFRATTLDSRPRSESRAGLRGNDALAQARADCGGDPGLIEADGSEQLRLVAVIDVAVGKPQLKERRADRARGERFGDGASRAAHDRVLFDGRDELVGRRQLCRQIRVERLHKAHIGDGRVELFAGLERGLQQVAEREQGDTFSAPPHYPLAKRQRTHL